MTPTITGDKDMKLLEIKDDKGYYYDNKGELATIDKITKDDILRLVNLTLGEEEVEFDEFSDDNLKNQAHKIIYKSIFEKLQDLKKRKQEFIDESERLYLSEYEKYRDEPSQQGEDEDENDAPSEETDNDASDDEISKMVDDL